MRRNKRFWSSAYLIGSSSLLFFLILAFIDMWIEYNVPKTGPIGNGSPEVTAMDWMLILSRSLVVIVNFLVSLWLYTKTVREESRDDSGTHLIDSSEDGKSH